MIVNNQTSYTDELKELDLEFKMFNYNIQKMLETYENLLLVSYELNGNTLRSPAIRSEEEAKFQRGTIIYKNNITELVENESQLREKYEFHHYAVDRIVRILQNCNENEVKMLIERYESCYTIREMAMMYDYSKSQMFRKINKIFEKFV
jgi:hypothetical protein